MTPLRVALAGCPPGTGNRGVDALRLSALGGLAGSGAETEVYVLDYGRGLRPADELRLPGLRTFWLGAHLSRRYYRASNLQQMVQVARLGLAALHPTLRRLRDLDAFLDVSGGDSFSDIYGARRFGGSVWMKSLPLALGVPLVLLPQTYGPYAAPAHAARARELIERAAFTWARDADSLDVVRRLLGDRFDPGRQRQTVDMAFGLAAAEPADAGVRDALAAFAAGDDLCVGLNVSGLLYNRPGHDREHFGFRASYRELIDRLLARLHERGARVVLVPHVASDYGHDCDFRASRAIRGALAPERRERTLCLPADLPAGALKWCIGRLDWLCATRMHAAIAGASQAVPTAAIAYSDKTLGVFETADVADSVFDPRREHTEALVSGVLATLDRRADLHARLAARRPALDASLDDLFATLRGDLGGRKPDAHDPSLRAADER